MAEWLYEAGIGEERAALVDDGGRIVAAAIALPDRLRLGAVVTARLVEALPGGAGRLDIDGREALIARLPAGVTQGARLTVAITREAIPEAGRPKPPRAAATDAPLGEGPNLRARLAESGLPVRPLPAHAPDALEAAGWSELLEEATSGEIAFTGGALRMTPTPAMTLFDVDGPPPVEPLAIAAARAVAEAIRRHDIGGSIGIDFPTVANKAARQTIAETIDAHLLPSFERTAVNGFGFLQIVRPRPRASVPELLRADPVGAAARATLRQLEREPPGSPRAHRLPAAVYDRITATPDWLTELARRTGRLPRLERA
ncbi:ribonuclease [Sphingomonas sp. MA1305]|uniref:ribonuclease n=1 Tax=Sphingomonas sp. MA1305 TaxID=2479204 RepID=UPI0018DF7F63|nr:ribonuclease [Sphingomonas sp. MA1305]MBI0473856.1 ribonuclease [Sphingomonas sp. MA1305]